MEVVLLERIERLGQIGDVVIVKPGYARNYLLPQKKALRATKGNLELFELQRAQLEADNLQRRDDAQAIAKRLDGLNVVVIRSAGETGQLYGSVNGRDVAKVVTESGFTVLREQVLVDRAVKALGFHDFRIRLHPEVEVTITANVARSAEEAKTQAKIGRALIGIDEGEDDNTRGRTTEPVRLVESKTFETIKDNIGTDDGEQKIESISTTETEKIGE